MVLRAAVTGGALSGVALGLIGSLQPDSHLHLAGSLWAGYRALATWPDGSLLTAFVWTWALVAVCLFVALRRQEKRRRAAACALAAETEDRTDEEELCLS